MRRAKRLAIRLIAVLFGLVMALLVAEVGLRVTRFPPPPLTSGRLLTKHRSPPSRPDFRDRGNPLEVQKAADVRRIVVVGDSFTWGAGVLAQDAYPDRMQVVFDRRGRAQASGEGAAAEDRRARRQRPSGDSDTPAAAQEAGSDEAEGLEEAALEEASSFEEAEIGIDEPTPDAGDENVLDREPAATNEPPPGEPATGESPTGEPTEAAAPSSPAPKTEVVNFSRPGWNTPLEMGALRRAIDRLTPDVLVLGYCLNDSEPLRRRELAELREGVFPGEPTSAPSRYLYAHSALYRIVFQRADNFRMRQATTRYYHRLYETQQQSWVATRRALGEMKALADARGIPFLLVVFPIFDSQLDHRYHYRALHETLAQTATELGIDDFDLLPRYQGIDARRLALDPFLDAHPSELAHRIAADAIVEELEKRGWLGSPAIAGAE